MKQEIAEKWAAALRSGEYKQSRSILHNTTKDTFCCLGVLCELAIEEGIEVSRGKGHGPGECASNRIMSYDGLTTSPPPIVVTWAGMWDSSGIIEDPLPSKDNDIDTPVDSLMGANDTGFTFGEIADIIDAQYGGM